MRLFVFMFFIKISLFANILDDYHVYKAQKAYVNMNYEKAYNHLLKIKKQNSKVFYNLGNTLYKQEKYEDAIIEYLKVQDTNLLHSTNHNIANCYLKLGKNEKALEFYNKALIYKNDAKTIYNIELIKQQQKELNNREKKELNKNICEIQRKGIFEELNIDSIFDYYEIDENVKLYEDKQTGKTSKNQNAKITNENLDREINISGKSINFDKSMKREFKMNQYLNNKFNNNLSINSSKTLIVPLQKGVVNDSSKAW